VLIRQTSVDDLDLIAPLFDAYRQFYKQPPDLELARTFLLERLRLDQSVIFLALDSDAGSNAARHHTSNALGFTQLYPSFSSGAARRIFILNDLFVAPHARRCGIGASLLRAAAEFGYQAGAARLTLSTALDNAPAQALYEAAGWRRDTMFCTYNLPLGQ
jgi:ribosomal protein S18 acetylase RimI-like enzyme